MAFADPQSLTIGSAVSLPRVLTDSQSAGYQAADQSASLQINQQATRAGRLRHNLQARRRKISTDVLTDVKSYIDMGISVTIDRPAAGFTEAEALELVTAVTTWLTASTNANAKKLMGGES